MTRSPLSPLLLAATATLALSGCGGGTQPTTTQILAGTAATSSASTTARNRPAVGAGAAARRHYAQGGGAASEAVTAEVRASLKAFGDALAKRDAPALCAHATGFDELPDADATCESLFANGGSTTGPTTDELRRIVTASVTVNGDRATADLGTGPPLPLRRVDSRWKIDYAAIVSAAAKPTAQNAN